jgi:hypothetical protein
VQRNPSGCEKHEKTKVKVKKKVRPPSGVFPETWKYFLYVPGPCVYLSDEDIKEDLIIKIKIYEFHFSHSHHHYRLGSE